MPLESEEHIGLGLRKDDIDRMGQIRRGKLVEWAWEWAVLGFGLWYMVWNDKEWLG